MLPEKHDINTYLANQWFKQGEEYFKLGRLEEAIACFDQIISIKPNDHLAWHNRGVALSDLGKLEEAVASYDQALHFQPDDHLAWLNRGALLSNNFNKHEEAITCFDQALHFKPDDHEAWLNRGVATGKSLNYNPQAAIMLQYQFPNLTPILPNPTLNQRGYKGELLCYQEGLKYCLQDTHPEGWGLLHHHTGNAHYFQGKYQPNYRHYWHKAETEYHQALITLTPDTYPESHLEVVQDLIRLLFGLNKHTEAKQWRGQGLEVLQQLFNSQKSTFLKRQLADKFIFLYQMGVDVLVEDHEIIPALAAAEWNKNFYLTWILDAQNQHILSPTYADIQRLTNPTTAIIYWHLSPHALTTFIIKHGAAEPIIIPTPQHPQLEAWIKTWNQQYQDYRASKEKRSSVSPWRDNLREHLQQLSHILNIQDILSHTRSIRNLILIPHRDLHRLPLHALFPKSFTITYLPSAQIGIHQLAADVIAEAKLLSIEHPNSKDFDELPYAEIESTVISQIFNHCTRISGENATQTAVTNALTDNYNILHFTGHANYNFDHPQQSALFLNNEDKLTLNDICAIPLNNYYLVTLAGCETALTGNQTIEKDYVGLVSAFIYQRVTHVVSTLWTIPDSMSSLLLMVYFYWQLKQGKPPAIALHKAQRWLRQVTYEKLEQPYQTILNKFLEPESSLYVRVDHELWKIRQIEPSQKQETPFKHPYYWAAFIITGKNSLEN